MGNRSINPNSLKNLEKGRTKGKGRPSGTGGVSWKELIERYGEVEPSAEECAALGITPPVLKGLGMKRATWKLLVVARAFRDTGNAAILKELIERAEGKVKDELDVNHSGGVSLGGEITLIAANYRNGIDALKPEQDGE